MANRQLLIALLVVPLWAMLGWWASGQMFGDQPVPAQSGATYPLLEKSNCRYPSGRCLLENIDFSIRLTYASHADEPMLLARASHPLRDILLAVGQGEHLSPRPMLRQDATSRNWRLPLDSVPGPEMRIRVVARNADVIWYGDAATSFIQAPVPGAQ